MERPRKPKIGRMEAHHTGNPLTYLAAKRSKVKVTRPINAVRGDGGLRFYAPDLHREGAL